MIGGQRPGQTARSHVFTAEPTIPAESVILEETLADGGTVLDVGCAATGRSARLARSFGTAVTTIDVNVDAIREFRERPDREGIGTVAASVTDLPFGPECFDVVFIALHGLDYLDRPARRRAVAEASRVLRPGGHLVFNTNNPVGVILSPRAPAHLPYLRWRLGQVARLGFLHPTIVDLNGLRLYQATPRRVVREIEAWSGLTFRYALSRGAASRMMLALTLLSAAPYYVFRRA